MPDQSNSTQTLQASSEKIDILGEASPASLEELMNRAPAISDAETDQIIAYLRAQREKFATQEAAPKAKKTPRSKGPILSADDLLGDIDLSF